MRCPNRGELRTLLDRKDAKLQAHVQSCPKCSSQMVQVRSASAFAAQRIQASGPAHIPDPKNALTRFRMSLERKDNMSEFGKRRFRPIYLAGVVVVLLAVVAFVSPVRSFATGLLDIFRVEKFAAITIDVSKLPLSSYSHRLSSTANDHSNTMEAMHPGEFTGNTTEMRQRQKALLNIFGEYSGPMKVKKPQEVDTLSKAENVTGTKLASLGNSIGNRKLSDVYVTSPFKVSYTFNTAKMSKVLKTTEIKGVTVPKELNGKTFTMNIPSGAFVTYGKGQHTVVFAQGASPTLQVPKGVNMDYLRQDFLMLPGLPKDLVTQIQQVQDWKHTLIIPLPPDGKSKDISVNGSDGLMISDRTGKYNVALWQHNGQLYALGGRLPSSEVLQDAQAIQYP